MVKSKSSSSSSSRDDGKNVQYKGVRMRRWGSWVSEIRAPSQKTRIWLGSYSTQEAAARAYDAALLCLRGSSASFNFPSPLRVHVPPAAHLSTKSIQRLAAAAAAANATTATLSPSPTASVASPAISTDTSCDCSTAASPAAVLQEDRCVDSWFDSAFQPHKLCTEMMMMMMGGGCSAFFDPQLPLPQAEESCFDEVGDIRLWSF